ncbi:uncharacterized protein J3R85_000250 [Psidium guajava]|nr:uncharacterized protein J3R85_000250 [Psidium guajava]
MYLCDVAASRPGYLKQGSLCQYRRSETNASLKHRHIMDTDDLIKVTSEARRLPDSFLFFLDLQKVYYSAS